MMTKEEVWAIFDRRASIRSFSSNDVDDVTVDFLLQCATTAPSSGNMQPWEFIVVRTSEMKKQIVSCTYSGYHSKGGNHQNWVYDAPVIIVACANQKRTRARYGKMGNQAAIIDVAAAVENILIAVSNLGLCCCWVGGFDEEKLKRTLNIPKDVKPIGLLPIGYPQQPIERKNRLSTDIIKHQEKYYNQTIARRDE